MLSNTKTNVTYEYDVVSVEIDKINYIMLHGHQKSVKKTEHLVLNYGKPGMYNLIVSGHTHGLSVLRDDKNFRHVVCPSLIPGSEFSKNLGHTGNSGYIIAYNNGSNKTNLKINIV